MFIREQATAKKCLKNLIDSDCSFSYEVKEVLDLGLADYNPFCANNRDPGATGNDQCYGVRDISAAAGTKTGVLQTLLFALMSMLFFFKV